MPDPATPMPSTPTPKPRAKAKPAADRRGPVPPVASDTPKPAPTPKTPPAPRSREDKLKLKLEELLSSPAIICTMMGDDYPAHIIATRAPAVAEAWVELAKENPAVKRVLDKLVEGSALGGVVLSTAALLLPVAGYYGLIPPMDPFAALYPTYEDDGMPSSPIVPPPPSADRPASRPATTGGGTSSEDDTRPMTAPVAEGQPRGVVTVAGLAARGAVV